jgi:hypothetical protein
MRCCLEDVAPTLSDARFFENEAFPARSRGSRCRDEKDSERRGAENKFAGDLNILLPSLLETNGMEMYVNGIEIEAGLDGWRFYIPQVRLGNLDEVENG